MRTATRPAVPTTGWRAELTFRIRRHFALKAAGTTAFIWVFFIGYFHLLREHAYPVIVMPVTRFDAAIPDLPIAIVPYLSLWFYVGIAPGLQRSFAALLAYAGWSAVLCGAGLAIFYRWPTRVPPAVFDAGGVPGFSLLHGIDAPGNACPSLHVAIAMFTAIWIATLLRECRAPALLQAWNATWFAAIALSTVAIRQHVVIDAVAGAVLGIVVAVPSLMVRPASGRVASASPRPAPAAMIATPSTTDESVGSAPHSAKGPLPGARIQGQDDDAR